LRSHGAEGYRGDASWLLVTIVVLHSTELSRRGSLRSTVSPRAVDDHPIDDADVLECTCLGSAGRSGSARRMRGDRRLRSACAAMPCLRFAIAGLPCPRCERRRSPLRLTNLHAHVGGG
jgi:hypothetical protein